MASPAAVLDILLTANTTQATAALGKTQAELAATSKKSTALGASAKAGFAAVAAGAVAAGVAVFKVGEEFDKSYDKIKTRTGATGKELKSLEQSFKNVVSSVPTDFDTASTAIAGLNQRLGLTGKPLDKLTKQVVALSEVTGTDIGDNVQQVTRLFGDWGVAADKQGKTLDGLFRVSQKTGQSVSDLASNLVQFGAPLRNLGVDMDTAAAMFGNFEKAGVNMTTVMSGLRLGVGNLNAPTDDLAKTLKNLGISTKDPQKALTEIFQSIKTLDTAAATGLGIQAFGKRAGPDLVDAVRGGKFELDKLIQTFKNGDGTIRQSEQSTRDFAEQWTLFKNRVMVAIEPIATRFFDLVGKGMKAIAKIDFKGAVKSLEDFWKKATLARELVTNAFKLIVTNLKNFVGIFKDIIKVVSSILTGEWGDAWQAVKDLFRDAIHAVLDYLRAMTAPLRKIGEIIGNALADGFSAAWDAIVSVFVSGANAIVKVINAIIDVINVIPGVSIGHVGGVGTPSHSPHSNHPQDPPRNDQSDKLARGGMVRKPMAIVGEQAPAHPEYVLATNPAYRKRNLALWSQAGRSMGVPGFALGGILDTAQSALTGAQPISASNLVDKLPDPNLPKPFTKLGPYLIEKATAYIKDHITSSAIGGLMKDVKGQIKGNNSVDALIADATAFAASFGLAVSSGDRPGTGGSYHDPAYDPPHRARDFSNGTSTPQEMAFARGAIKRYGVSQILEEFYNPLGFQIDNYAVGPMTVMDHYDHVHLAFAKGGILQALAQGGKIDSSGILGRPMPVEFQKWNHKFPIHWTPPYGEVMPDNLIAELAEWAGDQKRGGAVPGWTMQRVTMGESTGAPGAGLNEGGGVQGVGLWAVTSGVGNEALIAKYGGLMNQTNPVISALSMAELWHTGNLHGTWHGDQYVNSLTDHWTGTYGPLKRHGVPMGGNGGNGSSGNGSNGAGPTTPITPIGYVPPNIPITASGYSPKEVATIMKLAAAGVALVGDIGHAQVMDAFSWSPGGTDLSAGELAGQRGLRGSLVWNRQAQAALLPKAIKLTKSQPKIQKPLLGMLATLNDPLAGPGSILEALVGLDSLSGGTGGSADTSTIDALKLAEAQDWARRYQVSQAQYGVFGQALAQGGVIGGPPAVTGSAGGANTVVGNADVQVYMLPDGNAHVRVNGRGFDTKVQSATRGYGRRVLPGARGV